MDSLLKELFKFIFKILINFLKHRKKLGLKGGVAGRRLEVIAWGRKGWAEVEEGQKDVSRLG